MTVVGVPSMYIPGINAQTRRTCYFDRILVSTYRLKTSTIYMYVYNYTYVLLIPFPETSYSIFQLPNAIHCSYSQYFKVCKALD